MPKTRLCATRSRGEPFCFFRNVFHGVTISVILTINNTFLPFPSLNPFQKSQSLLFFLPKINLFYPKIKKINMNKGGFVFYFIFLQNFLTMNAPAQCYFFRQTDNKKHAHLFKMSVLFQFLCPYCILHNIL